MTFEVERRKKNPNKAEIDTELADFDEKGESIKRVVSRSLISGLVNGGLAYREKVAALKLNVMDLEGLAPDVQARVVNFYGRTVAGMQELYYQSLRGFVIRFATEYLMMKAVLNQPAQYYQLLDRIKEYVGYKEAVDMNTNVSGDSIFDAEPELERFAFELQAADKLELQEQFVNPYGIKAGDKLYCPARQGGRLEEVTVVGVADSALDPGVKEYCSVVDFGDAEMEHGSDNSSKVPLNRINRQLDFGRLMLRDGSNYFGTFEEPPQVSFQLGEKVKFKYEHPVEEDDLETEIEWRGTNEKDLNDRYGDAWRPYWRDLLMIITENNFFPVAKCKFETKE